MTMPPFADAAPSSGGGYHSMRVCSDLVKALPPMPTSARPEVESPLDDVAAVISPTGPLLAS
jgi:hypothetical protein